MAKIIRNIALLLVPVALYYCIFLAFEPNNYFGLRSTTPSGAVFGAIRAYEKNPTDAIIIGDSRLAHLDMEAVDEISGKDFSNLAFSGASLKESLDELDWILARYPDIDTVVFGLSFYTLNAKYAQDRFHSIEMGLANPAAYMTNLGYNVESLFNLTVALKDEPLWGGEAETQDPSTYEYVDYTDPVTGETVRLRDKIVDYMSYIDNYAANWAPNDEQFDRLLEKIGECAAKGVDFTVVFTPVHGAMVQYEMARYGIDEAMLPYIARLQESPADVYDYELTGRLDFADDMFYDGFHLDYERGLPAFEREFFAHFNENAARAAGQEAATAGGDADAA